MVTADSELNPDWIGSRQIDVATELGPGRLHLYGGQDADTWLLLGHGAGGGIGARDLRFLADRIAVGRIGVALYEQPWRVAAKKVAPAPARLDVGWLPAVERLRQVTDLRRLVAGGRSAGARVACRTAAATGADAVLCLAFPLHPPGRPSLALPPVPVTVVQGTGDPFGTAVQLREALAKANAHDITVIEATGADHSMKTRAADVGAAGAVERALVEAAGRSPESYRMICPCTDANQPQMRISHRSTVRW